MLYYAMLYFYQVSVLMSAAKVRVIFTLRQSGMEKWGNNISTNPYRTLLYSFKF